MTFHFMIALSCTGILKISKILFLHIGLSISKIKYLLFVFNFKISGKARKNHGISNRKQFRKNLPDR